MFKDGSLENLSKVTIECKSEGNIGDDHEKKSDLLHTSLHYIR